MDRVNADQSVDSWSYDPWGNRKQQLGTGSCSVNCAQNTTPYTFSSGNQLQIANFQYDAAGNLTYDTVHHYAYDAENRLISVDSGATATYIYDAEGKRVQKTTGSGSIGYVSDIVTGNAIEETNGSDTLQAGYIYLSGQLLAEYKNGTTYFVHSDHLGSTRVMTNVSGGVCESNDFLPFGESNGTSGSCSTTHEFTGKERDAESGLENFGARYNSSQYGRFMSPDPIGANALRVVNPQRWNSYSYAVNNPLSYVDPDGRDAIAVGFSKLAVGLGHAGIVSVHTDGSARFGDFGPRGGGKPIAHGQVTEYTLKTKIQFDSNGKPTAGSLEAVAHELSADEDQPQDSISMAYYKTF